MNDVAHERSKVTDTAVIRLEKVSRTYGEGAAAVYALRDVSISIYAGSFVTIVGASGSGKSTLLNLVGALDQPNEGTISIDGVELSRLSDDERTRLRRDKIGFVFQFFNLLPTLTAAENVALPARLAGRSKSESMTRAGALLDRVGLAHRKEHRPSQLSGGEMQRVAIARALIMDPPLLLADEPTGNLDSTSGREVLSLLRTAAEGRRTVVLVTHDQKVAALGERILTVTDGRVTESSPQALNSELTLNETISLSESHTPTA